MPRVLDITLPIFAVIFLGFFVGRRRLLAANASESINGFVYWIALPALLLVAIAERPIGETFNGPFIGAFLGSTLVILVLTAAFARFGLGASAESACVSGFSASLCNTAYIGVPLFIAAYGPERLAPAILSSLLIASVLLGLVISILEMIGGAKRSGGAAMPLRLAGALARNPLLVAAAAGVACSVFNLHLPGVIASVCKSLGGASGPCALFAMGLFIGARSERAGSRAGLPRILWIVALKLLAHPILAWVLAVHVFPMDPFWTGSTVILAALPTGSLAFVVAQQYVVDVDSTSTTILISTVLSIGTLSTLLAVWS